MNVQHLQTNLILANAISLVNYIFISLFNIFISSLYLNYYCVIHSIVLYIFISLCYLFIHHLILCETIVT